MHEKNRNPSWSPTKGIFQLPLLLTLVAWSVVTTAFAAPIPVIFDTDANHELDDQPALAYLHPAPIMLNERWMERPLNSRKITIWEHFDADAIVGDFFNTINNPVLKR